MTYHHLVPRSKGGRRNEKMPMCVECHSFLHRTFSNNTLMQVLNTVEKLKENYQVELFLREKRDAHEQETTNTTVSNEDEPNKVG